MINQGEAVIDSDQIGKLIADIEPRFSISGLLRTFNTLNLRDKMRKTFCHRRVPTALKIFCILLPIFNLLLALANNAK